MREILAYAGAGATATLIRFALMFHTNDPGRADPLWVRLITMIGFFFVLVMIDRRVMAKINERRTPTVIDKNDNATKKTPQETSDTMARVFAGVTDDVSR